jgi:antitoxin MazE
MRSGKGMASGQQRGRYHDRCVRPSFCETMNNMRTTIRRLGNSQGVSIPRSILDEAGFAIDSSVEMTVDGSSIVLRKVAVHPREGWADDAALVDDGPEDQEWLDADLDVKSRGKLAW